MSEYPLAYFLTWTTYGSRLPGNERRWVKRKERIIQPPDFLEEKRARHSMSADIILLSPSQRQVVDKVIVDHCRIRGWLLHARNVRTNHVHVVVSAALDPKTVREQFKAWASRRLSELAGLTGRDKEGQCRWWTEKGDIEFIHSEEELADAIFYVLHGQGT